MKRKVRDLSDLLSQGWKQTEGRLEKGDLSVSARQLANLGKELRVRRCLGGNWWQDDFGFFWPAEVFEGWFAPDGFGCCCGAKFSSLPDVHSEWCNLGGRK